jgi:hypothetical protein
MPYVMLRPYSGPVQECTVRGCSGPPSFSVVLDGRSDPGFAQVACPSHVGDLAGNMIKAACR